jgi:hypothetical protein
VRDSYMMAPRAQNPFRDTAVLAALDEVLVSLETPLSCVRANATTREPASWGSKQLGFGGECGEGGHPRPSTWRRERRFP